MKFNFGIWNNSYLLRKFGIKRVDRGRQTCVQTPCEDNKAELKSVTPWLERITKGWRSKRQPYGSNLTVTDCFYSKFSCLTSPPTHTASYNTGPTLLWNNTAPTLHPTGLGQHCCPAILRHTTMRQHCFPAILRQHRGQHRVLQHCTANTTFVQHCTKTAFYSTAQSLLSNNTAPTLLSNNTAYYNTAPTQLPTTLHYDNTAPTLLPTTMHPRCTIPQGAIKRGRDGEFWNVLQGKQNKGSLHKATRIKVSSRTHDKMKR